MTDTTTAHKTNFIRNIIDQDLENGAHSTIITRFPPEPNGFLHIGHAKAICINFGIARDYNGRCHMRFDDTNPSRDYDCYTAAILKDIHWLGFDYGKHLYYASDYYQTLYECALKLIEQGDAYVDSLSAKEMHDYRGTLTEGGKNSPDRDRTVEENLSLFQEMRQGKHPEGSFTLRAKIDMQSGNINLRDPVIYRILDKSHHRSKDQWPIYPTYDFAHALSDATEGITHSLCSLEFQDHRPLYDWCVAKTQQAKAPHQYEFSRLNLSHSITSKRKLKRLVDEGHVNGWDDPRMPTISGMRERGYAPQAIIDFCDLIGVSKQESITSMDLLEGCVRNHLDHHVARRYAVLDPIKVIIENFAEDETLDITVSNHPQVPELGQRVITFSNEVYIDRDDFMLDPPPKYNRLRPEGEVRLRNAFAIKCNEVICDESGKVTSLRCTIDKDTLGGKKPQDGRKIKGVIHWVNAKDAIDAKVALYDRLFTDEAPGSLEDFTTALNPESLKLLENAKLEPSLNDAKPLEAFQFTRLGYFCRASSEDMQFNRIVSLKETWQK